MHANFFHDRFGFDELFQFSPDFICIASNEGYVKKANPAMINTFGYGQDTWMNKPIKSFIYSKDPKQYTLVRDQSLSLLNGETSYITKTGSIISINWTSTPLERQEHVLAIGKNTTINTQLPLIASTLCSAADRAWLLKFEKTVRTHSRKIDLNLNIICDELAIGERQLFRRTKTMIDATPNEYVRTIRLQMAMEAIQTGKYRTIAEVAYAVGFRTPSYFKKIFESNFKVAIEDLL